MVGGASLGSQAGITNIGGVPSLQLHKYASASRPLLELVHSYLATNPGNEAASEQIINLDAALACARTVLMRSLGNLVNKNVPGKLTSDVAALLKAAEIDVKLIHELGKPEILRLGAKKPLAITPLIYEEQEIFCGSRKYDSATPQEIVNAANLLLKAYCSKVEGKELSQPLAYVIESYRGELNKKPSVAERVRYEDQPILNFLIFRDGIENSQNLLFELVKDEALELLQADRLKLVLTKCWTIARNDFVHFIYPDKADKFDTNKQKFITQLQPTDLELWQLFRNILKGHYSEFARSLTNDIEKVAASIRHIRQIEAGLLPIDAGKDEYEEVIPLLPSLADATMATSESFSLTPPSKESELSGAASGEYSDLFSDPNLDQQIKPRQHDWRDGPGIDAKFSD